MCEASSRYEGPCSSELFVGEMTPEEKAQTEIRCRFSGVCFLLVFSGVWCRCSICWPCSRALAGSAHEHQGVQQQVR